MHDAPPEYDLLAWIAAAYGWKGPKGVGKSEKQAQEEAAERSRIAADVGLRTQPLPPHLAEIIDWCDEQDEAMGLKKQ